MHTNNKTQVQLRFFLFLLLVLFGFFPPSERERERGGVTVRSLTVGFALCRCNLLHGL